MTKKVLIVFGTRPEAIKMAPLVKEMESDKNFHVVVCVTGQHRQMLDQVLELFDIIPDYDLNIMSPGQDLYDVTSKVLLGLREVLDNVKPDIVLVHGDTTTSTAAALAAFYKQIPVGHVEAGLRTHNIYSPWPEEMNRQLTGRLATLHFSPTALSEQNLIDEKVDKDRVFITGNTVIDALYSVIDKINSSEHLYKRLTDEIKNKGFDISSSIARDRKIILITGHRRENFGDGFLSICKAIKTLTKLYPNVDFVYPMHLNPNVREPIKTIFGNEISKFSNLFFIEPLEYFAFVYLMKNSYLILTDSGGIQEEAPGLGKPVLVMRDTTERPEAVQSGTVKLVGTDYDTIVNGVSNLLNSLEDYKKMSSAVNPYGNGKASKMICAILKDFQNFS